MTRRRATTTADPPAPPRELDLSRFAGRPKLKDVRASSTPAQRAAAWRSLRVVILAVRTLATFGLPVNSRSVSAASKLMTEHSGAIEAHLRGIGKADLRIAPVSPKTVLHNEMCACVLAAFSTSEAAVPARAKPTVHVPKAWFRAPRWWLIDKLAERTAERDEFERKYKAAVQAQIPEPEQDSVLAMLRRYAEAEAAAKGVTPPA